MDTTPTIFYIWLFGSAMIWLYAYRKARDPNDPKNITPRFVQPPRWLFFLCGSPQLETLPKGVMRTSSLEVQCMAILWVIEDILLQAFQRLQSAYYLPAFFGTIVLVFVISELYFKKFRYDLPKEKSKS